MLLNLLITIMAEARERAREEAHLVAKYRRAKLVVDHESMVLDDIEQEMLAAGTKPTFFRRCYNHCMKYHYVGAVLRRVLNLRLFTGEQIDRELVLAHQEPWIHMLCPVKLDSAVEFGLGVVSEVDAEAD